MSSSLGNRDDTDECEVVETDPTGRYVRYKEVLGEGSWKTVYKGFDEVDGIEIAWSRIELSPQILECKALLKSLCDEAKLLKSLKHENIMKCYHSWIDVENKTINMITELFTSGDLQHYCKKHSVLDRKAIKKWAKQILNALSYLHSHNPPIIHRDLKCENVFVNGNSGKVKIGDLGFARELDHACARSVTGTPGFMAPELYEQEYNQLVDVYAFGMCMLQMVTREEPYHECQNHGQIFKKVINGILPAGLDKVKDPLVKRFIERCLAPVSERPSAVELLDDPFLADDVATTSRGELEKVRVIGDSTFRLHGEMMEASAAIPMTLRINKVGAPEDTITYIFYLKNDTSVSVVSEMAKELEISTEDCGVICELMEELIAGLTASPKRDCREVKVSVSKADTLSEEVQKLTVKEAPKLAQQKTREVQKLTLKEAPKLAEHKTREVQKLTLKEAPKLVEQKTREELISFDRSRRCNRPRKHGGGLMRLLISCGHNF